MRNGLASGFFFSSRRRHTRSLRDWSSDVCSSDSCLLLHLSLCLLLHLSLCLCLCLLLNSCRLHTKRSKIGRASCRERVEISVVAALLKKKTTQGSVTHALGTGSNTQSERK